MQELYGDIKEQESKFKKTLEICCKYFQGFCNSLCVAFIIDKNKELYNENQVLNQEMDKVMHRLQYLEEQNKNIVMENEQVA